MKANDFPEKRSLVEALLKVISKEAYIDCYCDYYIANFEGPYISIDVKGYGRGKKKSLLGIYLDRPVICAYIPRISSLEEFENSYGFCASRIRPDNVSRSNGKPYHTVAIDEKYFTPLVSGEDATLIRRFLIQATRNSLALRGLSKAASDNLHQTESLVRMPALQIPGTPTPPTLTPLASDLNEGPADRVKSTTYRILRDTELARRVKAMHNGCCQICGATIKLRDGTNYAEAHHIQPLGQPHNGPDMIGNIICVCPNHHAELDYRIIPLDLAALKKVQGHSIDPRFVDYHNRVTSNPR